MKAYIIKVQVFTEATGKGNSTLYYLGEYDQLKFPSLYFAKIYKSKKWAERKKENFEKHLVEKGVPNFVCVEETIK